MSVQQIFNKLKTNKTNIQNDLTIYRANHFKDTEHPEETYMESEIETIERILSWREFDECRKDKEQH